MKVIAKEINTGDVLLLSTIGQILPAIDLLISDTSVLRELPLVFIALQTLVRTLALKSAGTPQAASQGTESPARSDGLWAQSSLDGPETGVSRSTHVGPPQGAQTSAIQLPADNPGP